MTDASDSFEVLITRTRALEQDFIGLTVDEARVLAEHLGVQLRLVESDGQALDASLRSNRITVDVRTGRVTSATAG
jgi:hypothetical protein